MTSDDQNGKKNDIKHLSHTNKNNIPNRLKIKYEKNYEIFEYMKIPLWLSRKEFVLKYKQHKEKSLMNSTTLYLEVKNMYIL